MRTMLIIRLPFRGRCTLRVSAAGCGLRGNALTSLKPHTDPTIYNVQWVLDFFREVTMQLQITSIGAQLLGQKYFDLLAIR